MPVHMLQHNSLTAPPRPPAKKPEGAYPTRQRRRKLVFFGLALTVAVLLFRVHFRLTMVVGNSMLPTLAPGNLLLVDTRAYNKTEPRRGDVVVASDAAGWIVKRIVGLPGEEVEVKGGKLYINGAPCPEHYPTLEGALEVGSGKLLDGDFASLGDNRAVPSILAVHPILSKPDILGKVVFSSGKRMH